jgi:putative transcription factor
MDVGHHQDWNPVVIRKKTDKAGDDKEGGGKKGKKPGHSLDDNKDEFKNKKISKEISQSIIQHRCAMKLNQKALAGQVNIKPEVLQKYENGQAIVDPRILNKIKRILKMK